MKSQELVIQQRQKEAKALKLFLLGSLLASLASHAGAMTLRVEQLWGYGNEPEAPADDIELTVTDSPEEEPIPDPPIEQVVEPPPEPESQDIDVNPEVAPVPVALAPESQAPLAQGEDAPSNEPPSETKTLNDLLTNLGGDINTEKSGTGPITSPNGTGSGFGNSTQATGFIGGGNPNGSLNGQPNGQLNGTNPAGNPQGQVNGNNGPPSGPPSGPEGSRQALGTTVPLPLKKQQPICLRCPKPKYRGTEASPKVDMVIRPDGSVEVKLRQSSGNPDLDRETLRTMGKWRFDPKTVPEGGTRKKVRVTYEEEGSKFQKQNVQRRQQETQKRQTLERIQAPAPVTREQVAPAGSNAEKPIVPPPKPVIVDIPPPSNVAPVKAPPPKPAVVSTPPPAPVKAPPKPVPIKAPPPKPAPKVAPPKPLPIKAPPPKPLPIKAPPPKPVPIKAPPPKPVPKVAPPKSDPVPGS